MFTKILVPLDGSELAEHVLQYVRAVATGCNVSEVILLRIVEPLEAAYSEIGADWRRECEERIKAEAEDYISKMADNLKKVGSRAVCFPTQHQAHPGLQGHRSLTRDTPRRGELGFWTTTRYLTLSTWHCQS
ncbi:universal stress protein, partial [Dehalococcoidia bacterium]|nr:universal stress protein [Dehalococcoidia bacterium]